MVSGNMENKKYSKQRQLGQYMTTEEVATEMCSYFLTSKEKWVVFDPTCGDGMLLQSAAKELIKHGVAPSAIELIGFDIDPEMLVKAQHRLNATFAGEINSIALRECNTLKVLEGDIFLELERSLLERVTVVIGNPPYGKGLEVRFFEACDSYFKGRAELVFLLPMSFADQFKGVTYDLVKGRPLGVTTGHVIAHHMCGAPYLKHSQKQTLDSVAGFTVLTGVKLYSIGAGTPTQTEETLLTKPYSSDTEVAGWLPCLRTGDIGKNSYVKGRLWVKYGIELAHPKEITRFSGPRIFIRRVPIWKCKSLGATYIEETALCAGDVLIIKHLNDDIDLLKGLCAYLNSPQAAEFIIEHRPSVGFRDSFPKISAKDLVHLLKSKIPAPAELLDMANTLIEE